MWPETTAPPELEGAAVQASVISLFLMSPTPHPHPKLILQFLLKWLLPVSEREFTMSEPVCPTFRHLFLLGGFSSLCQVHVPLSCKYLLSFHSSGKDWG